jgi:choline-sulfatase
MALLDAWHAEMMATSSSAVDPLWQVMQEGGPFHTRGWVDAYCKRLRETGRAAFAEHVAARHSSSDRAISR